MNTRRGLLIYAVLCALAGIGTAVAWIAATGAFHPPLWAIVGISVAIGLVCDPIAHALNRPWRRPSPARRRAHARTTSRPFARSANQSDKTRKAA